MTVSRFILLSVLSLVLTTGCRSTDQGAERRPNLREKTLSVFGRPALRYDVEPPPGIEQELLAPLSGEALTRARLPLKKILASLDRPDYLNPTPVPTVDGETSEPPLAAQKAYVQARSAWREGDSTQTRQLLESALRLAPNEPTLLRMLGEVYTRTGNRIKGAQYFRQAVQLVPGDARSLYILGRFAIEKGDHGESVVLFNETLTQAATEPALMELNHHFLGNALRSMGYAGAAIDQFDRYVELAQQPIESGPFTRDQVLLRRQIGVTRQLMGDLSLQLDNPDQALMDYDRALDDGVPDRIKLEKRKVYAALRLSDQTLATDLLIGMVRRGLGDAQSQAMVRYAVKQGLPASPLARELQAVYISEDRPAALAIAAADVMPDNDARKLLTAHLTQHPEDAQVFHRLLRYYMLPAGAAPHSEKTLTEAAKLTESLMTAAPGLADEYGSSLVTHINDAGVLLQVLEDQPDQPTPQTMRTVLQGLCLAVLGRFDEAQSHFEQAVEQAPDLPVARVELAKALFVQDDFEQAAEVLKPLADSNDTGVILLRARVLAETGQKQQAVDLIDRVVRETGGDPKLIITQASLELQLGRAQDAEQTLLDALNTQSDAEPIYEALLDLYDPAPGRTSPIEDQTAKWRVLVKRLLGTIPNSRTGRLVQAQLHDASRNYDQAATILEGLLAENPDDPKALTQLLETYHAAGRSGEAIALLESRLSTKPKDPLLLGIAQRFYRQTGDAERLFDVQERLLMLEPEGPDRSAGLAFLYNQAGKYQQAVDILETALAADDVSNPTLLINLLSNALTELGEPQQAEQVIRDAAKRFADHEADLNYFLAITITSQGDQARGEQVMRDNLKKHPDHGPTNNGLGYAMLMRNEDIENARKMIQRAVDDDPQNEAYMDSLGWAYYKLGKFEDAEVWLRKAHDAALQKLRGGRTGGATLAVVSDHLGDALYRLKREPEALRAWSEAASHMRRTTPDDLKQDPELATMNERVRAKITALRAKQPVPVADLPEPEPAPKPQPEPKPAAEPAPEPKPEPKPKPEAKAEKPSKPAPTEQPAEAKPEPAPEPAPEAGSKPEPKPEDQPKPAPKPNPEANPENPPAPAEINAAENPPPAR